MNWTPCSERMPDTDGKYLVTVETTDPINGTYRKIYSDCGYDAESKRFYFYTTISDHGLNGDDCLIYIEPDSRIVRTGTALAWMPKTEIEPYAL